MKKTKIQLKASARAADRVYEALHPQGEHARLHAKMAELHSEAVHCEITAARCSAAAAWARYGDVPALSLILEHEDHAKELAVRARKLLNRPRWEDAVEMQTLVTECENSDNMAGFLYDATVQDEIAVFTDPSEEWNAQDMRKPHFCTTAGFATQEEAIAAVQKYRADKAKREADKAKREADKTAG